MVRSEGMRGRYTQKAADQASPARESGVGSNSKLIPRNTYAKSVNVLIKLMPMRRQWRLRSSAPRTSDRALSLTKKWWVSGRTRLTDETTRFRLLRRHRGPPMQNGKRSSDSRRDERYRFGTLSLRTRRPLASSAGAPSGTFRSARACRVDSRRVCGHKPTFTLRRHALKVWIVSKQYILFLPTP
jgi:hypothetical protein